MGHQNSRLLSSILVTAIILLLATLLDELDLFHGPINPEDETSSSQIEIYSSRNISTPKAANFLHLRNISIRSLSISSAVCLSPEVYIDAVVPGYSSRAEVQGMSRLRSCVIAGFDHSHELEGANMILSIKTSCFATRIMLYDFGLSDEFRSVVRGSKNIELLSLPYGMPEFEAHFERGSTGFKPLCIADAITRGCETGAYLDTSIRARDNSTLCGTSGHLPVSSLGLIPMIYSNREFTHPAMYKFFSVNRATDRSTQHMGGVVFFNASAPLWEAVLCRWLHCCMHKACVLPQDAVIKGDINPRLLDGFDYRAHRDDQSALNLALLDAIAALRGSPGSLPPRGPYVEHMDKLMRLGRGDELPASDLQRLADGDGKSVPPQSPAAG